MSAASAEMAYFETRRDRALRGIATRDQEVATQAWGAVMDMVYLPRALSGGHKLALRSLLHRTKAVEGWQAQVPIDWISQDASCSRRTTQRRLRALEGMGLVHRDAVVGAAAKYRVDVAGFLELVEDDLTATDAQRRERREQAAREVAKYVEHGKVRAASPTPMNEAQRTHLERGRRERDAEVEEEGSSSGRERASVDKDGPSSSASDGLPPWLPVGDKVPTGYTRRDCFELVTEMVQVITGTERAADGADWRNVHDLWRSQSYMTPSALLGAMRALVEASVCRGSRLFAYLRGEVPHERNDGTVVPTLVTPRSVRYFCQRAFWRPRLEAAEKHHQGACGCRASAQPEAKAFDRESYMREVQEQAAARAAMPKAVGPEHRVEWLVGDGTQQVTTNAGAADAWFDLKMRVVAKRGIDDVDDRVFDSDIEQIAHEGGVVLVFMGPERRAAAVEAIREAVTDEARAVGLRIGALYEATAPPG